MSANSMKAKMWSAALFAALVLSAMQSVRADEATYNYWEGGSGNSWTDKNSETGKYKWTTGGLPTATETAAFKQGKQTVKIKEGKCLAAKVVFESDSVITFSRLDSGTADAVTAGEFSGEGTLKLLRTGLKAADAGCTVSVAGFDVLHDSSFPSSYSWLDGGTAESKKMVVESAVIGGGNLACNNYVEVNGDVTLTGFLKLSANATVKNLVYDNGGCKIATDSAGGTIEKVTVKSGTLDYSSSTLKSVSVITVGKFVLDGGTLSVASDFSGTIAVAEGGGTLFLEGEWNDAASVSLPAGLSFAEGADLSKVTVQATIGESTSPAIFAIVNDNEAYSLEYVGYPFHLEELDLSWMTSGWETPKKNKAVGGGDLQLWDGTEWQKYERGIGTHAGSSWYVRLNGNAVSFSATVGVDRESDGQPGGEVNFIVRDVVGGTNLVESGTMTCSTPAKNITANLGGIALIELVVDKLGSDSWDHADWVCPTIVMKGDAAPVTRSADGTNHWTGMGENDYWVTAENWEFGVPAADATAVFDESVTVRIGQTGENSTTPVTVTVSNVVVNSGATLMLRPVNPEFWDGPELIVQEVNGAGKIQLAKVGIKANYVGDNAECMINVAEIEMLPVTRWNYEIDSWLHGESNEGKFMVVNSKVIGTGRFYTYGNVTLNGDVAMSREFKMASGTASAKTVILDGGWVSTDNLGEIEKLAFHSGTYNYADYSDKGWPLYLDGGAVNIGDGSSIGSDGLELGVLSGGYLRYTVSEIPEAGVPGFPAGLTFAADADLSNVFAIVNNTAGDARKIYAITKTGDVYSFAELVPTDTVKWIGGVDDRWYTGGNWIYGAAPTATQTAVFERSAYIYLDDSVAVATASNVTIAAGATVTLSSTNEWGAKPRLEMQEITGEGTLALKRAMLTSVRHDGSARIACKELCIVAACGQSPDTGVNYVEYFDSQIGGSSQSPNAPVVVTADITGGGYLKLRYGVKLYGDNSGFRGVMGTVAVNDYWNGVGGEKCFCTPESLFSSAYRSELNGRIQLLFDNATVSFGNVAMLESFGTGLYLPYGTENLTIEVTGGTIRDNYQGLGCGVYTRAEGSESIDGATVGCEGLTIKKVGNGTLVYGLTKAHNLVVAEGRVEFTGENNNGDDVDVNVTVKAGANIGSSESLGCGWDNDTQSYKNGFVGGDVTVRHQFAFEPGAAIKQEYIATTTTDEQTQEETTTYSMRKLTIARDVELANVVFGVTNPEDLPAVTKASHANLPRFTMFAANSLIGMVATENDGYAPDGSEKNCKWLFRTKRNSVNEVEFYPFQKLGFAVIVR